MIALRRILMMTLVVALRCELARAQILIVNNGGAYTQDFDTLASTGTSSTVPSGWAFVESGSAANTTYAAGTGSDNTGNTYSFGAPGSGERAFGELSSNSIVSTIGAQFQNNGATSITKITLSYFGEQWRYGNNASDKLDFQISFNATSLTTGTWTDVNSLDFGVVNSSSNNSALDGNASGNRQFLQVTGFALPSSVAPNATFWIRWAGTNVSQNDSGLAIDDFSLAAVPEPSTYLLAGAALLGLVYFSRRRNRRLDAAAVRS